MIDTTYAEFVGYLARKLDIEEDLLIPSAKFTDDLLFDSLRMIELLLLIEDLAGSPTTADWMSERVTVEDAYQAFRNGGRQ